MFEVFDNGKTADSRGFPSLSSIAPESNKFDSFDSALEYATWWCGGKSDSTMLPLLPDIPWDYSGYGDMIEIRTVV